MAHIVIFSNGGHIQDFEVGYRVEVHPATDRWMRGDRFGTVTKVGRKLLTVHFDRSGQTATVTPRNIYGIAESPDGSYRGKGRVTSRTARRAGRR